MNTLLHQADIAPEKGNARSQLPGVFLMTNSFETGGSERQFTTLAGCIDPNLFRLKVGCITKHGSFLGSVGEVEEFPLGGSLYGVHSMQARLRLAQFLRKSRISIAHAFDFYSNLTLIPAARMAGVPVVIGSQRQLGDLLTPAKARVQRTALSWCDSVICNSHAAANLLVEQGLAKTRVSVIGNGFSPSTFALTTPALSRRRGLLRVGMVARMNTHSKNHKLFLHAAALLQSKFHQLEFVLVGEGPLRSEFEGVATTLGIRDKIHFLGNRGDIPAILASIDVSVLPSDSESLSNVIIESMAAGVPVVASNVGGNPELLAENRGILIPAGDEKALADAIERLLLNSELRDVIGREAKKFAEKHFTLAELRERHQNLYAELLAGKAHGRTIRKNTPQTSMERQVRVAVVAPTMRYVGGQSVQAELLLANWRGDPSVSAQQIPIDPDFPYGLRWAERIPFLRTFIREPIYTWKVWRGLKNADIAHIFSASYWSFILVSIPACAIAHLRGAKVVLHYHSGEARDHLKHSRLARNILRFVDRLVVPSQYLVDVFREFALSAEIVPNTLDLSQFSFRIRERLRAHLICTRGFHAYYRIDIVVRAFAEVQKVYPEASLDLIGGGPLEEQIRDLVNQLQLTKVSFAGVKSRQQIARSYDQADIFINASSLDNMPVSVLEAFASGTPVVSTAPEGMHHLIEHERTGLLSDPTDHKALAQNVFRLLQDPVLCSQIANAAHRECQLYSWQRVRVQWLTLYRAAMQHQQYIHQ